MTNLSFEPVLPSRQPLAHGHETLILRRHQLLAGASRLAAFIVGQGGMPPNQAGAPRLAVRSIVNMPFYESVFIARQDLSATAAEALADKFAKILDDNGGSIEKREYWGLRNLAYRIKKNRKGHYFLFNVSASPSAMHELERNMGLDEDLLRHLTIKVEELDPEPSPIMKMRGNRTDGDRPRPYKPHFSDSNSATDKADNTATKTEASPDKTPETKAESDGNAGESTDTDESTNTEKQEAVSAEEEATS